MNFSLDFLYTFWVITALQHILPCLTTRNIPTHRIASPHLASIRPSSHRITLHLATLRIASGHTPHRIWSHLASYRIDQDDLPLPRTLIRYKATNITTAKQKQSLDRQIDIDVQDVHYGPSRTGPAFRWSTLAPRLDAWIDETLHTGARLFTSKKRDRGQPSTLRTWWSTVPCLNPDIGFS